MKLDSRNGDAGLLFDAHGNELPPDIVTCDTETGECLYFERDARGNLQVKNGEIVTRIRRFPAPLLFIRRVEGDAT